MGADILYIDDEAGMVELVQLVMQKEGMTVQGASSGNEGLAIMHKSPPKIVLLDIMMPDMDGWEVYQQIRADAALKDIPVIIVTVRSNRLEEIIAKLRAGVDGYITKPFNPSQLREAVKEVLSKTSAGF